MFDWDADNATHIWEEHRVTREEAETVLSDPFQIPDFAYDVDGEAREAVIGMTVAARVLFVVFTWRGDRIRVLSARNATRREARHYRRKR